MIKVDGGAAAEEFAPGSDIDIERISFHPEQRTKIALQRSIKNGMCTHKIAK